jgi:hypothetical protein
LLGFYSDWVIHKLISGRAYSISKSVGFGNYQFFKHKANCHSHGSRSSISPSERLVIEEKELQRGKIVRMKSIKTKIERTNMMDGFGENLAKF